jgi:hypothetical protein
VKTLRFEGHSDDTFGEYNVLQDDYDCCASGRPIVFRVDDPRETEEVGLLVIGQYAGREWLPDQPGCWMIGIQQLEEDIPLPPWPMRWSTADSGYSPRLEIDVPDNVLIRCLNSRT